jgi:hypothetical protein
MEKEGALVKDQDQRTPTDARQRERAEMSALAKNHAASLSGRRETRERRIQLAAYRPKL